MTDRRSTDQASHAHKRSGDSEIFARLHQRLDDNDMILTELMTARAESVRLHNETTIAVNTLNSTVAKLVRLAERQEGLPEIAEDIRGTLRFMGRISNFVGLLWKPMLFIAVLGGSIWMWAVGGKPPP